jgi:DNA-binding transcriptional ArsR family regulator
MTPQNDDKIRTRVFENLAGICGVFAAPVRLKIVQILAQSPQSVEEIAGKVGESVANTSQHLQRLGREGVVHCERKGVARIYRVASPQVVAFWEAIQDLGQELSLDLREDEAALIDPELKASLSPGEVMRLSEAKRAVLLDVRDERDVAEGGLSGAKHHPASQPLTQDAIEQLGLRKRIPVFVFCRGRYCSLASRVTRELRHLGYDAYRLRESPFQLKQFQRSKTARVPRGTKGRG